MNVSTKCKNHFEENFNYMNIPVDDNDSADLAAWFPQTISFIGIYKFFVLPTTFVITYNVHVYDWNIINCDVFSNNQNKSNKFETSTSKFLIFQKKLRV